MARARSTEPITRTAAEREDPAALAARAQPWGWEQPEWKLAVRGDALVLGARIASVVVPYAQLYHVEPVDPWPSIALGWVEGASAYSAVLTPPPGREDECARRVEEAVAACRRRVARVTQPGWLDEPELAWEAAPFPDERSQVALSQGYRAAPAVPDPIVAHRVIGKGAPALLAWLAGHLVPRPRRLDPTEVLVTRRYVYARARSGRTMRLPLASLRAARGTDLGDRVYTFGRNTELLVVAGDECPVTAALDARLGAVAVPE